MDQQTLENLKKKIISTFKLVFKLKVIDTYKPHYQALITFFDQNEDTYQALKPGDRLRLMSLSPAQSAASDNCLALNMTKTSQIFHVTDSILKPKKAQEQIEKNKGLIEKSLSLNEFKRKYGNDADKGLAKDADITFYGYVLKVISSKNKYTGELEVMKAVVMTHDQEIVLIECWDKQYIFAKSFPKEKSYIFFDNLTYLNSVLVSKKDQFEVFTSPLQAEHK